MKLVASIILLVRTFWHCGLLIFSDVTFIFAGKICGKNNYVIFFCDAFLQVKLRELYLLLYPHISG